MTSRFKIGLTLLLALAIVALGIWLSRENADTSGASDLTIDEGEYDVEDPTRLTADGQDPNAPGGPNGGPGPGQDNSLVGARTPSGIDYSDPEVRKSELKRLLDVGDWRGAARIVGLMTEPVPEELRAQILYEIKSGKRLQAMHVFRKLRDPTFVQDLFDILDNPDLSKGAHKSALEALWQMPGAPADDVALRLESRLNNDMSHDRTILFAIAARGGTEAARAMVEYIQRAKNPAEIPQHILQRLDVRENKEAARIVSDALQNESEAGILTQLVKIASQNGAREFTEALIDLDRNGVPQVVREQSLHALSQIGDEKAIDYLLEKSKEPGAFGESALRSVAMISSADPAARLAISKALDEANKSPRPEQAKASLLLAIGAVGDKKALPTVARQLDDGSATVQRAAARAMGRLGPSAESYVPKLATVFQSGDDQTRIAVTVALGSIGGEKAVETLERGLKEKGLSESLKRTLQMALKNAKSRLVRRP